MSLKIKIFKYLDDLDAFVVTDEYREIADAIGLTEWNPVVWIGRLFTLDNDYGEHWFDNWELLEKKGLESGEYLVIDPDRFKNDKNGPCNTPEFRKRFWTDVLISLELGIDLLFDKARQDNEKTREWLERDPGNPIMEDLFIPDLEDRIKALEEKYSA